MKSPFFGPFDVTRTTNLADNNLINLYPELGKRGSAKDVGALYMTPGLTLVTTAGNGPIWGLHVVNDVLYVVSGSELYSINSPGTAPTHIKNDHPNPIQPQVSGSLIGATQPVTMIDNFANLAIWANQSLFNYDIAKNSLSTVVLPFTPSGAAAYQDGFFLAAQAPSTNLAQVGFFFQSNLLQPTTWDALDFASASGQAEPILAMIDIDRELFLFQPGHCEVWVNAGLTTGSVFQRLDGVYIEYGIDAPYSLAKDADSLIWLGRSNMGSRQVIHMTGFRPRIMSTPAVEAIFQSYALVSDAIGFCYQQDGHNFYQLTFPSADATWVLDITTSDQAKTPMWHRRAALSSGVYHRHAANSYALWQGLNVVGDYQSGNIYKFDLTNALDNGVQRKWVRSWRAMAESSKQPQRFASLQIDMQTGIGVPDGTDPLVVLKWSDDGGRNWSKEFFAHAGKSGETARRVKFNRLGSTRRNSGLDRIFELSSSDNFLARLIGAELE